MAATVSSPATSAARAPELTAIDYPEGLWRVPLEMALTAATTAYVEVIRRRRDRGDLPDDKATVFRRGGLYFAHVSFRQPIGSAVIFALPDWDEAAAAAVFGKRTTPP